MTTMESAISTAQSLAEIIGEPQLIRSLECLRQASHDLGLDGEKGKISDSYAMLGLSLAYVWDDHSAMFRDALMRILMMVDATGDENIIEACRKVKERFLLMSDRIAYVEVSCKQKPHWT